MQALTVDRGDTAWMLVSTILVLMMTLPGLALFYGGLVARRTCCPSSPRCSASITERGSAALHKPGGRRG